MLKVHNEKSIRIKTVNVKLSSVDQILEGDVTWRSVELAARKTSLLPTFFKSHLTRKEVSI